MSLSPTASAPTKREFATGYVAGVGVVMAVGLFATAQVALESTIDLAVVGGTGLAICGTIGYLAYTFRDATLSEEFVWTVAEWTALGIGVGTLSSLLVGFGHGYVRDATLVSGLLVGTIVAGGLLGTTLGVIAGLRTQRRRLATLVQRNAVLNRVLRHNIKNDMNVILGHTTLLEQRLEDRSARSVEAIERAARNVTRLSRTAREIDRLSNGDGSEPVDVARTIEACVGSVSGVYPEATITTDVPEAAWVDASPIVRPALSNLLENAVEHNDGAASVHVAVDASCPGGDRICVHVADDGPGIVDREREVLRADHEGPIRHGSGLGLWLVKWFVDRYDGELRFEANDPRGTVVHVSLPAADAPDSGES